MVDVYCPRCGEPWDLFEVSGHPNFIDDGCVAMDHANIEWCQVADTPFTVFVRTVYELMGDDLDGCASMLEDAYDVGGLW